MTPEDTMVRNLIQKHLPASRERATQLCLRLPASQRQVIHDAMNHPLGPGSIVRQVIIHNAQPAPPSYHGPGRRVRLRRRVSAPGGNGPINGQCALQRALEGRVDWLEIGGRPHPDDLMWYWCWDDVPELIRWDNLGLPWVAGPNILFTWSQRPLSVYGEKQICSSPNCRLLFTESQWYVDLIQKHQRPPNVAPIVTWTYPIEPKPDDPLPAEFDVLIYAKSGPAGIVQEIQRRYQRCKVLRYGQFNRRELFDAARKSRCCVYVSNDDRGPLALMEILLAGCPTVGVERGAPFVEHGVTGLRVDNLQPATLVDAVEDMQEWHREGVREVAMRQFGTERQVEVILGAIDNVRQE